MKESGYVKRHILEGIPKARSQGLCQAQGHATPARSATKATAKGATKNVDMNTAKPPAEATHARGWVCTVGP